MEPLSRDVKRRRWKLIGHILRKDKNSDDAMSLTWAPEGKRKRGSPKTTWQRMIEKEREEEDGSHGRKSERMLSTERSGDT